MDNLDALIRQHVTQARPVLATSQRIATSARRRL